MVRNSKKSKIIFFGHRKIYRIKNVVSGSVISGTIQGSVLDPVTYRNVTDPDYW